MNLEGTIRDAGDQQRTDALHAFLARFLDPAFGALPKSEIELLVLNLLESIGVVDPDLGVYELVSKLKVTRSKARSLIYERELRRLSATELDSRVRELLKRPIIQKAGELFILEVESPLVSDHLREKVQKLGHVSDGSFSPSIVKLPLDAIAALIELFIPERERLPVKQALIAAGAPDASFRGVVKAVLKRVAAKVASDTGEALMENASSYISPIVDGALDGITGRIGEVFAPDDVDGG